MENNKTNELIKEVIKGEKQLAKYNLAQHFVDTLGVSISVAYKLVKALIDK